jgi:hypothetical protein
VIGRFRCTADCFRFVSHVSRCSSLGLALCDDDVCLAVTLLIYQIFGFSPLPVIVNF